MDTFFFPMIECSTVTPEFSQQTGVLSCRTAAPPVNATCEWNAQLSSELGTPLYSCSSVVNGVMAPVLRQDFPACFMAADRSGQVVQFACPRTA
jgi:hypothetical protein